MDAIHRSSALQKRQSGRRRSANVKRTRSKPTLQRSVALPLGSLDVDKTYNSPILPFAPVHLRCSLVDLPVELVDKIAAYLLPATADKRGDASRDLRNLALTQKRFIAPAQRALIKHVVLSDLKQSEKLTKLLLKKRHLGQAIRSLEIKMGPSDAPGDQQASSSGRRTLELNLLGLLPLIKNVRKVTVSAAYDCPNTLIDLLTGILCDVRSFSLVSAFGYAKLVFVSTASLSKVLKSWPRLERLSMTMRALFFSSTAWLIPEQRRDHNIVSNLGSIEISGYRGDLADLEWLLNCATSTLTRFSFDCPLDNQNWSQLAPTLGKMRTTLTDISLWSWTYAMPVTAVLKACPRLRNVCVAAHDCTPELFASMPDYLQHLLICTHPDFSPLDSVNVAEGLSRRRLPRLTLYDPSATEARCSEAAKDPAWSKAIGKGSGFTVTADPRVLGCHIAAPTSKVQSSSS